MKGTRCELNQSMDEMIKQETLYEVISCHLKDGSFLVLQCSERVDVAPDEGYAIFYHTVVYLFHTSGFFKQMRALFYYTADQVYRMSEPSRENSLKLKPRGCHTATTQNSGQTGKVISVRFHVRGHMFFITINRFQC